jgi:hypothetical protein
LIFTEKNRSLITASTFAMDAVIVL